MPPSSGERTARSALSVWSGRIVATLGSLQLAILLLSLFALSLLVGTLVESWHDHRTAQGLVYRTWWFVALLAMLGGTITCAALKKWPWRRHQTGFLVTHVGLLLLVSGGLLTNLGGTQGSLALIDSDDLAATRFGENSTTELIDSNAEVIHVARGSHRHVTDTSDAWSAEFRSETLPWESRGATLGSPSRLPRVLDWLANPFRQSWSRQVDEETKLEVLQFLPNAEAVPYQPLSDGNATGFPAFKLELASGATGTLPARWLAGDERGRTIQLGPAQIDLLGVGWTDEQIMAFLANDQPDRAANGARGILEFATNAQQQIVFRSFSGHAAPAGMLRWEKSGPVSVGNERERIWQGMDWSFRVTKHLPSARAELHFIPKTSTEMNAPPPLPALRCRLSRANQKTEFWLARTDKHFTTINVRQEDFSVGYHVRRQQLGFSLTLLRTEQTTDQGTKLPASQASLIRVTDLDVPSETTAHWITMNEPLFHRGYKIYQSNLQIAGRDRHGKPIHRSILTISRDPGVRLKYFGATLVAAGIVIMFYMRAYFFKPKQVNRSERENNPANV